MKRCLCCLAGIALLLGLVPLAAALERPPLHPDVQALCQQQYPGYAITAVDGYGDARAGQWALVLSKEGQHVLVLAEKAKEDPAYRFTVENAQAIMQGDSHPGVIIDSAGDSVFVRFSKGTQHWSFSAFKHEGAWGEVSLILSTRLAGDDNWEWLMGQQQGLLFCGQVTTDGDDNIKERFDYPPLPAPWLAGRSLLTTYNWQDWPEHPPSLLGRAETLQALTPAAWTQSTASANWGGIYLTGQDAQGARRLLIKHWVAAEDASRRAGHYVDTVVGPLPEGALISEHASFGFTLYLDEQTRAYSFGLHGRDSWRMNHVSCQSSFGIGPNFFHNYYEDTSPNYHFGSHPFSDIRSMDLQALPKSFEQALAALDQSSWAVVNNPDPKDRLHLREKPDRNAASLGKFYNGCPVEVLARQGDWVQVRLLSLEGWMQAKYLAFGQDMQKVWPAFPGMIGTEATRDKEMPAYALPDEGSLVNIRGDIYNGGGWQIVGLTEDGWYYVWFIYQGTGGYMKMAWFWEGNG